VPQVLWSRRYRSSLKLVFVVSILINVGMWLERFIIIVTGLAHDRIPWSWHLYKPRLVEAAITVGSFGWFFFWFLVFVRLLPAVSIAEMKEAAVEERHVD